MPIAPILILICGGYFFTSIKQSAVMHQASPLPAKKVDDE
jgi:hypothetical protein